jgi:hypothetical protein
MTLAKDSAVYYPERYYYSLSNLDAFALSHRMIPLTTPTKNC